MPNIHHDLIIILDFGSQYTQLIARRVREFGVFCKVYPYDVKEEIIIKDKPMGIILSGGPETAHTEYAPQAPDAVFSMAIPVLGICYGMQTMAQQMGGKVTTAQHHEYGHANIHIETTSNLLKDLGEQAHLDVWMSHGDHVVDIPPGFSIMAASKNTPIAAMGDIQRHYYALQFHPEVTHTQQGDIILQRFVQDICQCQRLWTEQNIITNSISNIRKRVGSDRVLLGLSGGVDSSVVAALLHEAIGKQLVCVFVDNGLLRFNEAQEVMQTFAQNMGVHVIKVAAEARFLDALKGAVDPEKKRKIIGNLFIKIFEEEAEKLSGIQWLAQGTIYPDVIESAGTQSGHSKVIKSHHNVGGLPKDMTLKLLEPLRELFKDEVRRLGTKLGLPAAMVYRHPFPGPGLGVRILGEVKKEYADILRLADAIFIAELRNFGWYDKTSQAFVVFLPIKSVGVVGDNRQYDYVVTLRCIETVDFMTAKWSRLPYELLDKVSTRIINEVSGISRVAYDISGKPPATVEWE